MTQAILREAGGLFCFILPIFR